MFLLKSEDGDYGLRVPGFEFRVLGFAVEMGFSTLMQQMPLGVDFIFFKSPNGRCFW